MFTSQAPQSRLARVLLGLQGKEDRPALNPTDARAPGPLQQKGLQLRGGKAGTAHSPGDGKHGGRGSYSMHGVYCILSDENEGPSPDPLLGLTDNAQGGPEWAAKCILKPQGLVEGPQPRVLAEPLEGQPRPSSSWRGASSTEAGNLIGGPGRQSHALWPLPAL